LSKLKLVTHTNYWSIINVLSEVANSARALFHDASLEQCPGRTGI
jgi:hypothetical protein